MAAPMTERPSRQDTMREVEQTLGLVPTWMKEVPPQNVDHFWGQMRDLQLAETAIPGKYKELIGLAVAAATRCSYCTFFHTEAAKLHGATQEEIREAGMMGGWTMEASTFIGGTQTDLEAFKDETRRIGAHLKQTMGGGR